MIKLLLISLALFALGAATFVLAIRPEVTGITVVAVGLVCGFSFSIGFHVLLRAFEGRES